MKMLIKNFVKKIIPSEKRQIILRKCNYLLSGGKKIKSKVRLSVIDDGYHSTCGYYDLDPVRNGFLLYITSDKAYEIASIKCLDIKSGKKEELFKGLVLNWQQGNRLRWLGEKRYIFNSYENDSYISVECDHGKKKLHSYPVYDANETFAISIDFNRLGYLRPGYGYTKFAYNEVSQDDIAISVYDIETDEQVFTIRFSDILRVLAQEKITINDINNCYINHISISPLKDKFLFFFIEKQKTIHMCYLMVWEKNGIKLMDRELSASHYTWKDNKTILATMYTPSRECGYFYYNTESGKRTDVLPNKLKMDGHPTFIDGNVFVTDTYPDKAGFQKILLVNEQSGDITTVLKIYSTSKHMGVQRCDLHPRYSVENNRVYFDADIDGRRRIYSFLVGENKV